MDAQPPYSGDETVIRVRGLRTRFGPQVIHDGLDLDVRRGEVLGVVGGSGTGKSVLLKEILGLIRPAAGSIEVLGHDITALSEPARVALQRRWGVLFQDGALFSSMTVAENVAVPLREHTDLDNATIEAAVRIKIRMAGLPEDSCSKKPSQLSGGMRKRAGLARALALDPEILFLDEPTAGLDPIGAAAFDELVGGLQRSLGLTVFMVTHDLDSLITVCDRIAALVDRRVRTGTVAEMLTESHPWIRNYFHGPRGRAAIDAQEAR
ncbi:ABC transporter ATP-binding protein [Arenibaculum pallidiluteum]|uniref:ABC transporter ATP-binding protein n=1 Tax=Arenibaculum pallidiluteum TaxID=2812559 RepID=UPI001A957385|nr:ABC transporter ATP-binding protein [Arenibaculum pallidiluteum]